MISLPNTIPLAYSPPPLPGWGLSSFPYISPNTQIRPYKARPALPLCDTLASGRRAYKRPTQQRKRNQWFQPLRATTQGKPTRHRKSPVYAPRPATHPIPTTHPHAPIRSLPATGPPSLATATGPPSLATGPPCAPNKRFTGLPRQNTNIPYTPLRRDRAKIRLEPIPAKIGVGTLPEFARNLIYPVLIYHHHTVALDLVETSYTKTHPEIRPRFAARFRLRETTRAGT